MNKDLMLSYEMEMAYITKKSSENLDIINPRKLRGAQVDSLTSVLMHGEHFDSCLVVNQKKGYRLNVIDGQHRVMAMRNYFKKYPDARIQVSLAVYKNLTEEEERDIFRKWNVSIKQSTDDFINSYRGSIPMFQRFVTDIPCSIYGTPKKIKLKDLINAYIGIGEHPYKGAESRTTYDFIRYMKELKDADVDKMKYYFGVLQDIFNPNNAKDFHKLSAFKNVVFRALFYLVANNVDELGDAYVKRRMSTVLANRTILDQYRRYYGRRSSVDAYLAFKNLLNQTASEKQFK
jgi:hypothetical protein